MKITVAGTGYVGLSLACLFAQHHAVKALDIVEEKTALINSGRSPIKDKDISAFLAAGQLDLHAGIDLDWAYEDPDLVVIATPTNYDEKSHSFDTSSIEQVLDELTGRAYRNLVVIKSTIPVGYTESVAERFSGLKIVFSPEFLRESHALEDNLHPSRIVVGVPGLGAGDDSGSQAAADELVPAAHLFADLLVEGAADEQVPVLVTGATEAEAIKLFANTYLATRVAYFNELDTFAALKGLDVAKIIEGVGLDPRIGSHYNNPSFGFGGYCLPKDSKELLAMYEGVPENIIKAVVDSNETRKRFIAAQVLERKPAKVGIYRLIMKQDSDNFRASSIQGVIAAIAESGTPMVVYEPRLNAPSFMGAVRVDDLAEFADQADVIVANRMSSELAPYADKVYTRDLTGREV